MKANPLLGTDSGESHAGGVLWRPQQPVKILHLQRDGSFTRERPGGALQGDGSASVADHNMHTSPTFPTEKACIKTVRATMFDHHVQRHNVAADHLGAEPPSRLADELPESCRESWMGKAAECTPFSKEAPHRPRDALTAAEKPGKANSLNRERVPQDTAWKKYTSMEKCGNPTPKHAEDSLVCQRIEPRYEILQTVGKRAQSEALAMACEDKAVTLRSRRSLKERRRLGESFVDPSWSRSLDLKHDYWKEDSFISKGKEGRETAAEADTLQAFNASLGQLAFSEQVGELDKNQTGQKHVTAEASCLANGSKDVSAADCKDSVVCSELEREKSRGKTEASKVLKHFSEKFGAGPGRIGSGGAGANVSQSAASGSPSEPEQCLPGRGGSQWQAGSGKAPHHSAELRTYGQEESKGFGLRKHSSAHCAQETPGAAGHRPEGPPLQRLEAEEQGKRSCRRASAGKVSERWRRKTLPHDIRFEDAGSLAEEGAKVLIRRDSLQFHEGSIAKKSRKPRCIVEPKEGTSVSPSSPEDSFRDQPSPSKPKATYFAVTYQIPNEAEGSTGKEFAHKSRWFSSLVEDVPGASDAGAPRRHHPASDRQFCAAVSDPPGSLDRHFGKSWEEAGGADASALLQKGALKYPASGGKGESGHSLQRQGADAKDSVPGIEPPLRSVAASSPGEQRSPSYLRHLHQGAGDHLGQKKRCDFSGAESKEKTAENYRSRVLDIDALMAEYKEDSLKSSVLWDRREGEDSGLFHLEKCRRSSSDKTSVIYSRKDPQVPDDSPRSPKQVSDLRRQEMVCLNERERPDSWEPSSILHRDGEFRPPPWGRPPALDIPADATSSKKKTFILDEEPGASLTPWFQSASYGEYKAQLPHSCSLGLKVEAGLAPHPSLSSADCLPQKGTFPKQQVTEVPPEGDGHNASSLSKRKSSGAGSPRKGVSSAAQSPAEWSTSASADASLDVKRPHPEKTQPSRAKGSLPVGPEAKEKRDHHRVRQSFPPEQADNVRQSRRSTSQQRYLSSEEKKVWMEEELGSCSDRNWGGGADR